MFASGDNRNADRSDSDFESGSDLLNTNNDSSAIEVFTIAADNWGSSLDSISQFIVEINLLESLLLAKQNVIRSSKPHLLNLLMNLLSIEIPYTMGTGSDFDRKNRK